MMTTKEIALGGKTLTMETGRFARQASGSVMITLGETMVLATVVLADSPREGIDFFPLSCEYREKTSAAGKIPGGFFKREGKPSEKEVLSARLIDRPIRPMFADNYRNEVQIVASVYSSDQEHDGDVLAATAASAALMIAGAPFEGPIAEVRVCRVDGKMVINPTFDEVHRADLEVVLAGTKDSILMVEGEAKEISERDMLDALEFGHKHIVDICQAIQEFADEAGKPQMEVAVVELPEGIEDRIRELSWQRLLDLAGSVLAKEERASSTKAIYDEIQEALAEDYPEQEGLIKRIIHDFEKDAMRKVILEKGQRLDGRGLTDVRPINCDVQLLPRAHGSALFTRGETQALMSCTLGTKSDEQIIDGLRDEFRKRFMLHYNFPPFSVGEVGRFGFTSRREIGHGNLAERALKGMLPSDEEFPYTIRLLCDILESNGSSSMATVCSGSMALMDAGVPIKKAVAGVAMGLIKEDDKVAVLTDILGNEDHLGDMDFKVAGTRDGINSYQMDIKIKGISFEIMERALEQARDARMHILDKMEDAITASRDDLSKYAPRLTTIMVPVDMIGAVIGPGGKTIKSIVAESGAEVNIEDDGRVIIAAVNQENSDTAVEMIKRITAVPEEGETYTGPVKKITDFGAFVEIIPGKEGLLHISQIDFRRINSVEDVLKVGDMVTVKLLRVEDNGKLVLSRKALMEPPEGYEEKESSSDGGRRGGDRDRRGGGRRSDGGGGDRRRRDRNN
ncbi:MAG: polyribonucleotide nucleotidyltransferase [Ignavibacteria bacterium]|nr:MAG: polyribonucleotide nucleotidyltransferase [Ignavibacteria bacterium]